MGGYRSLRENLKSEYRVKVVNMTKYKVNIR